MKTDFTSLSDFEMALNWREAINHEDSDYSDNIRQQIFAECDKRKLYPETMLKILEDNQEGNACTYS